MSDKEENQVKILSKIQILNKVSLNKDEIKNSTGSSNEKLDER